MILVKTEAGHLALKDRSVGLTPRQRSAFILFDGKRAVSEVIAAGMGITEQDIEQMMSLGLLDLAEGESAVSAPAPTPAPAAAAAAPGQASPAASGAPSAPAAERTTQQRYQAAYPVATKLTASLGLRGFKLNLQVEGTSNYEELLALAPKIRAAVSPDKAAELDRALGA